MNFALQHLLAAAHFVARVRDIESANAGKSFGAFFDELLWNSTGSILSGCAGLEAYANEMFFDRSEYFPGHSLPVLSKWWELLEPKPVLEKFDAALILMGKSPLARGQQPFQDVEIVISLRNALVHFKPEEWNEEQSVHGKLSRRLASKFSPSQFLNPSEQLFPRRWASASAVEWALRSVMNFLHEFETGCEVPQKIAKQAGRLRQIAAGTQPPAPAATGTA